MPVQLKPGQVVQTKFHGEVKITFKVGTVWLGVRVTDNQQVSVSLDSVKEKVR